MEYNQLSLNKDKRKDFSGMKRERKSGFTLIEVMMVIVVMTILSVAGASLMIYIVRNAVFIPNKLNMDMVASDALDIMIEGDHLAKGLRFSRFIEEKKDYQLTFMNQNNQRVRYRLDPNLSKLYRSINNGPESLVPYYLKSGINLSGKDSKLFAYLGANEAPAAQPADVRRVLIHLVAKTGNGSFADWEGQSEQVSSIAVKKFQ
ncbi:MAG: prepilin-type N-terminal cleavage/methylation domain-containing protein [Candidatus Omnitrophota bacterium]